VNATLLRPGPDDAHPTPTSVTAERKVGFRYVALVTGNDTDAQYVQHAATEQGTELHGMMFRINGAAIFARGANMM
jgi:beta-mannosidase